MAADYSDGRRFSQTGPARSPSLHDIELSDAVLILGEDVTNSCAAHGTQSAAGRAPAAHGDRGKAAHSLMDG